MRSRVSATWQDALASSRKLAALELELRGENEALAEMA